MHVTPELLAKHDKPGPRYTSYPTAIDFDASFGATDYEARLAKAAESSEPLSLYVHLPFCQARCLYCACHVVISPHGKGVDPYMEALRREIELVSSRLGGKRRVTQLHLGGGTPTYHDPDALRALLGWLRAGFALDEGAEVAVELDPRVTTPAHLEALAAEGFNRVSLGVQDFDPKVQEAIGRVQSVEQTRALIAQARALGISSVNLDLIYGLPHQTPESFRETLGQVVELGPDRLAIYAFAWVPWLKGHQKKMPQEALPDAKARLALLAVASEVLTEAGYVHIGMDHFAKPDDELCRARAEGRLSRNFMGYTTSRAPDMIGLGLSSIGFVDGAYVQNEKQLAAYERAIEAGRLPVERGRALSDEDHLRAYVIRELMCNLVVHKGEVRRRFGVDFDAHFAELDGALGKLTDDGLIREDGEALRVEPLGQLFVRSVAMLFDAYTHQRRQDRPTFSRTV
jgi:oxygen-independent coproporphyrinogen-3 oxidase